MKRDDSDGAEDRAVYVISVAAELAGVHPQTLRIYERKGLVTPRRTAGNSRRYSDRDIELLRRIQELTQEHGVNLAGARMIIELLSQVEELQGRVDELRLELTTVKRPPAGNDEEGKAGLVLPHPVDEVEAVHARHVEVGDDEVAAAPA